jgi:hypothetical protein
LNVPLALETIRYGDTIFFNIHPDLNHVPILVYFMSTIPELNRVENWGTFSEYEISSSLRYNETNSFQQNIDLLDMKTGDVTGDGQKFVSLRMFAAVPGTNLISPISQYPL